MTTTWNNLAMGSLVELLLAFLPRTAFIDGMNRPHHFGCERQVVVSLSKLQVLLELVRGKEEEKAKVSNKNKLCIQ